MKRATIGLALSATRAVAASKGSTVADDALSPDSPEALATFLGQVKQATGARRVRVFLAPDLCELRVLDLPPLARDRAARALSRAASRHFLSATSPIVVDVVRTTKSAHKLALAAPSRLVEAIEQAAAQVDLQIDAIGSCYEPWSASGGGRGEYCVLVQVSETVELLRVSRGALVQLRRFPHNRADLAEAVLAADSEIPVLRVNDGVDADALSAAARYAGLVTFELRSEGRQAQRAVRTTRSLRLQWAAALGLLCCAIGLERWGLQRELGRVQTLRDTLRSRAGAALSAWDSAQSAVTSASEIVRLEATRSNWSGVLLNVAEQLPDSTRLLAFQGQQDTMTRSRLRMQWPRWNRSRRSPSFARLQIVGSIQRRDQEGGNAIEHFVVAAPIHQSSAKRQ